jgi:hypothetical protein
MNILILELGGSHSECIHTAIHYFHAENHRVFLSCNVFLQEQIIEQHKLSGYLPLPEKTNGLANKIKIIKQLRLYMKHNKIDVLYFNTLDISWIRYLVFLLPTCKKAGILHDSQKITRSLYFKYFAILSRLKILTLSTYKGHIPRGIKVQKFLATYFPKTNIKVAIKPTKDFWVVVPGAMDFVRKDFLPFLDYLSKYGIDKNIYFIFLGRKSEQLINKEKIEINPNLANILYFEEKYIEYGKFHAYMEQADLILPLFPLDICHSFYGKSRISGAFNLSLAYCKPIFLPIHCVNEDLKNIAYYYKDMEDMFSQITHLAKNTQHILEKKTAYNKIKQSEEVTIQEFCDFCINS